MYVCHSDKKNHLPKGGHHNTHNCESLHQTQQVLYETYYYKTRVFEFKYTEYRNNPGKRNSLKRFRYQRQSAFSHMNDYGVNVFVLLAYVWVYPIGNFDNNGWFFDLYAKSLKTVD